MATELCKHQQKEDIAYERVGQTPTIQKETQEKEHLSKEDPFKREQPKEEYSLEWINKK